MCDVVSIGGKDRAFGTAVSVVNHFGARSFLCYQSMAFNVVA